MPWIVKVAAQFETEEEARDCADVLTSAEHCFELEEIQSPPSGEFSNN